MTLAHARRRFKSSVLRYLANRAPNPAKNLDIAAQYSSDLIKGTEPQSARHSPLPMPLSSGVSHVHAFPPTPGMPRPLEPQEHQKSLEHQDSLEPQGSRPVCCDIGVFGPHFGPHSEKTQHTPRRSATRREPPCREGRHRQAASHTSTPVCAAISRKSGPKPGPKLQYRSTVLDTPTKSPPPRPTNASKMQHSASQRHTPQ